MLGKYHIKVSLDEDIKVVITVSDGYLYGFKSL